MEGRIMLYTAQFGYKGPDRVDITYKANTILSPEKALVHAYKYQGMTDEDYTGAYMTLLFNRKQWWPDMFQIAATHYTERDVTIVCFCPKGAFCHRHLAAQFMNEYYNVPLGGEKS
jgi:hypothetical protein